MAELAPGGHLAEAYEASVRAADAVVDRLRREAQRVALKARLIAEKEAQSGRRADLGVQLQTAEDACRQLRRGMARPVATAAGGPARAA